ncbi:hypothetical protein J6590_090814 [Homalodisca vitripennis]|nr:hypothetical protein J6590_090814 [Homalodisca vitripennis]
MLCRDPYCCCHAEILRERRGPPSPVFPVTWVVTKDTEYLVDAYFRIESITGPELQHVFTDMKGGSAPGSDNILA